MGKLLLLFTVVPLLETFLIVQLGIWLGFWPTVGIVVLTALLGTFFAKMEGLKVWRAWQSALAEGRLPEEGILGGVLVLIGGVLLVTPGILTDLTGIALLMPPSRRVIAKHVRRYLETRVGATTTTRMRVDMGDGQFFERVVTRTRGGASRDPNVIDAESEVVEERRASDREARGDLPR